MAPERRPFWAKCDGCGHCWPVATFPSDLATVAKSMIANRHCPKCGGARSTIAKQEDGILLERINEEPGGIPF